VVGPSLNKKGGSAAMSVLQLRGVSKTYGQEPAREHALGGVDLSVQAGEMVAVMGPSGSGKSTLLTIAGSLEEPTSGDVLICGMALAGMPQGRKARLRRRVIGYVFQDFNLLPGLTAAENAALPLELDGVAVPKARAAGLAALAGVDLSVRGGEMVAVMGPSGSGKSTLLTIAGSLEDPTSGEVLVCGMAVAGMPRGRRARLRRRVIGYVFQDFNLLPGLTAAENAALPLELDGVPVTKARAAGLAALAALGVADRAVWFPDQLSGGERQRVAIARAVVGDRRLLLADEPSGALDSVNAGEVMRLLHEACQRGVAAVVVTHDAQLAAWADRIVLLRDGRMTGHTTRPPGPESLLIPRETR